MTGNDHEIPNFVIFIFNHSLACNKYIVITYLDVSWVVCTVEVKKSLHEYPRKKLATPIEANTTATQPSLNVISDVPKYFQPCKLVQLQNLSKLDWVLLESSIISSSTSKRIVPFGVVEQAWGPFIYYVSTWRGGGGSKNCPYCLFSVQKICLHKGEGGQKSPKLCLRNIWMVPFQPLLECAYI